MQLRNEYHATKQGFAFAPHRKKIVKEFVLTVAPLPHTTALVRFCTATRLRRRWLRRTRSNTAAEGNVGTATSLPSFLQRRE